VAVVATRLFFTIFFEGRKPMLKKQEVEKEDSVWNNTADDEPVFIICGRDPLAVDTIRTWCRLAQGVHESEKIQQAEEMATWMQEYWHSLSVPANADAEFGQVAVAVPANADPDAIEEAAETTDHNVASTSADEVLNLVLEAIAAKKGGSAVRTLRGVTRATAAAVIAELAEEEAKILHNFGYKLEQSLPNEDDDEIVATD
jgi:hypothetical protein